MVRHELRGLVATQIFLSVATYGIPKTSGAASRDNVLPFVQLVEEPADEISKAGVDNVAALSNNSMAIVGSLVQSFLNKEAMNDESRDCLVEGSEQFTRNIMLVTEHIVMLTQQVLGQRSGKNMPGIDSLPRVHLDAGGDNPQPTRQSDIDEKVEPESRQKLTPEARNKNKPENGAQKEMSFFYGSGGRRLKDDLLGGSNWLMHLSSVFVEMGTSIQLLVKLSHHIANECIDGDGLESLEAAGRNARDIKYIAGHFLANGADVMTEFATSMIDYRQGNYSGFGSEIGMALRKIVLSPNTTENALPQGVLGKYMMINMSMGFVRGFFGKGFSLGVTLDKDPTEPLNIDLEDCIANNVPFFEQIWSALAYAYTKHQQAVAEGNAKEDDPSKTRVQFGTALAVAAMQFPDALRRCQVGDEQADMLIDSVKAFGAGMHLTLSTPNELMSADEVSQGLGQTIKDWKALDWYSFGFDLGLMLQEMVLELFPKKYAMGSLGLKQQLSELRGRPLSTKGSFSTVLVISSCFAMLVVVAASLRLRPTQTRAPVLDAESLTGVFGLERAISRPMSCDYAIVE